MQYFFSKKGKFLSISVHLERVTALRPNPRDLVTPDLILILETLKDHFGIHSFKYIELPPKHFPIRLQIENSNNRMVEKDEQCQK